MNLFRLFLQLERCLCLNSSSLWHIAFLASGFFGEVFANTPIPKPVCDPSKEVVVR